MWIPRAVEHYSTVTHLTPSTPVPRFIRPTESHSVSRRPISDRTYRCAFTYVRITKNLQQSPNDDYLQSHELLDTPILGRLERRKIALRPLLLVDTNREPALRVLHKEVQEAVNECVKIPYSSEYKTK